MEPLLTRAMHQRIETLRQAASEVAKKTKPVVVPKGKRTLLEREAGPLRRVLREEKMQTELDHRLAEESQRMTRGKQPPGAEKKQTEPDHRLAEESQRMTPVQVLLRQAGFE